MSSDDSALCEMLNFSGIWNFLLRDCQSYPWAKSSCVFRRLFVWLMLLVETVNSFDKILSPFLGSKFQQRAHVKGRKIKLLLLFALAILKKNLLEDSGNRHKSPFAAAVLAYFSK